MAAYTRRRYTVEIPFYVTVEADSKEAALAFAIEGLNTASYEYCDPDPTFIAYGWDDEKIVNADVGPATEDDEDPDFATMTRPEANDWATIDGIGPMEMVRRQHVVDSTDDDRFMEEE